MKRKLGVPLDLLESLRRVCLADFICGTSSSLASFIVIRCSGPIRRSTLPIKTMFDSQLPFIHSAIQTNKTPFVLTNILTSKEQLP